MSWNWVRVRWRARAPDTAPSRIRVITEDDTLTWAAKGLGCYLASHRAAVKFPNKLWDGTMDAMKELNKAGYIDIQELEDGSE